MAGDAITVDLIVTRHSVIQEWIFAPVISNAIIVLTEEMTGTIVLTTVEITGTMWAETTVSPTEDMTTRPEDRYMETALTEWNAGNDRIEISPGREMLARKMPVATRAWTLTGKEAVDGIEQTTIPGITRLPDSADLKEEMKTVMEMETEVGEIAGQKEETMITDEEEEVKQAERVPLAGPFLLKQNCAKLF